MPTSSLQKSDENDCNVATFASEQFVLQPSRGHVSAFGRLRGWDAMSSSRLWKMRMFFSTLRQATQLRKAALSLFSLSCISLFGVLFFPQVKDRRKQKRFWAWPQIKMLKIKAQKDDAQSVTRKLQELLVPYTPGLRSCYFLQNAESDKWKDFSWVINNWCLWTSQRNGCEVSIKMTAFTPELILFRHVFHLRHIHRPRCESSPQLAALLALGIWRDTDNKYHLKSTFSKCLTCWAETRCCQLQHLKVKASWGFWILSSAKGSQSRS